ncbi:MAG: hypothetical protein MZW92_00600 [Comamonadaceae bacterium]|nr:hypothetical protein [Comamonadaceae bacterium]
MRGISLWLLRRQTVGIAADRRGRRAGSGLTGEPARHRAVFAALPTASSAYILAMRMGGDGRERRLAHLGDARWARC